MSEDSTPLGPISPEAEWAKVGQEYDESEVEAVYQNTYECDCMKRGLIEFVGQIECEHTLEHPHSGRDICLRKVRVIKHYKLIGPCGHMH